MWLSRVQLFATPWTIAYQASPSMGFSRQSAVEMVLMLMWVKGAIKEVHIWCFKSDIRL